MHRLLRLGRSDVIDIMLLVYTIDLMVSRYRTAFRQCSRRHIST